MFKKILSAAAALVISASAVAGGLMNNTANALDLGGFLEEEMENLKKMIKGLELILSDENVLKTVMKEELNK